MSVVSVTLVHVFDEAGEPAAGEPDGAGKPEPAWTPVDYLVSAVIGAQPSAERRRGV
jgi:hypothetical protein